MSRKYHFQKQRQSTSLRIYKERSKNAIAIKFSINSRMYGRTLKRKKGGAKGKYLAKQQTLSEQFWTAITPEGFTQTLQNMLNLKVYRSKK